MSSHRQILPAQKGPQTLDSRQDDANRDPSSSTNVQAASQQKRSAIKAACEDCRKKKSKCDGGRPSCSACIEKGITHCHYEVGEGQTRATSLKQQVQDLKDVISALSLATDKDAAISFVSKLPADNFRNLGDVASTLRNSALTKIPSPADSYQKPVGPSDLSLKFSAMEDSAKPAHSITKAESVYVYPIQPVEMVKSRSRLEIDAGRTHKRYWFEPLEMVKELEVLASSLVVKGAPVYALQIANEADDRYVSSRYTEFITMKRDLIYDGYSPSEVLGPATMDPRRLLEEGRTPRGELEPVCHWATEMVKQYDKTCVAEKLALIILVSALARWQIFPTFENYDNIPECMRPTPVQILVRHPAWIDYIPWPEIRDYFIKAPVSAQQDDVLGMITQHTHINWAENHVSMVHMDPMKRSFIIHEEFERYGRDINNWSLDHAVAAIFPAIADKAWIKEHIHIRDASFVEEDMQAFRALIYENDPMLTEGEMIDR